MCRKNRVIRALWVSCWLAALVPLAAILGACGPSLPGQISLVKTVVEEPVVGMALFQDRWLYVTDEDGKLKVYDIKTPEEPKRVIQVDAFKDESYQMGFEVNSQWLVLVGKSGKIAIFDIRAPEQPAPIWGNGKSLKLKGAGSFFIRTDSPVMYVSPTSGAAIHRIDLGSLGNATTDQAALDTATKTIAGGGGGGILMPYTDEGTALRIYVGNQKTGKLDIWDINKVEKGEATEPVASVALKAGTDIKSLHLYQDGPKATQGWIIATSASGEAEFLDLDKRYRKADEPASIGAASIPGLFGISNTQKVMISDQLSVFDFSAELAKPTAFAEPEIKAQIIIRSMVIHKEYVYTAEAGGLRLYKYTKKAN